MPLESMNGPDAIRIRKANTQSTWGVRAEENRVEPIAKPAFDVPFELIPGEPIFTIGSCFARNVEAELLARGFKIPMRQLFNTPAFEGLAPEIVNNFGTPSIYNEFAWAFGEERFDEAKAIVEVGENRYADLHIVNSVRPGPLDDVLARRRGLMEATRTLADCRVLVMTLGLAEVWWDEEAQTYLNTVPLPGVMKAMPGRFSLHVLSFEECHDYLRRALDLAFKHGRDDLRVILTVSPVPMFATHRREDVLVANSYSKSVLRAVAEQIVTADQRIVYFPSYESIMLSDRRIAWMDDFVHVTRPMVEFNIARMVDAYTGRPESTEQLLPGAGDFSTESAEALLLAEKARQARTAGDDDFFDRHAAEAAGSPAFAIEFARFLMENDRPADAVEAIAGLERSEAVLLRAEALLAMGEYAAAEETVRPLCNAQTKGNLPWHILLDSAVKQGKADAVFAVERDWLEAKPRQQPVIVTRTGMALGRVGEHAAAIERLSEIAEGGHEASAAAAIACATAMLASGDPDGAVAMLKKVTPRTEWQIKRIRRLHNQARKARAAAR
ncbi:GSCFA domain-containing protein [Parasphingopyxis marina]|uniref:GSCFA domain-containing protein n=1 Tax=Parasphingopyxis marina TaxID=2761622 RepID=A0A842HUJ0_9SPHN|nr:GSCFA domain-containing protein [Parasphingopyxis marina]MBC2776736.1 GSCFA domain-containing protein [Parasphingopyxis marina]